MEITVNQKTLRYLFDGGTLYKEMIDFLNGVIEAEFQKENMDCDLIDECVNAMEALQKELAESSILERPDNHGKKRIKLSTGSRAVIAAALAVILGLNVLYHTSPTFADSVRDLFSSILSTLHTGTTETPELANLSSIYTIAPDGNKIKVTSEADIDEKDFIVIAVYQDGNKSEIPVRDCLFEKSLAREGDTKYLLVRISYGGCSCAVAYEMEGLE